MAKMNDGGSVERFCQYLRIKTVHPEPDYEAAVQFLRNFGENIGLTTSVYYPVPNKPVLVLTAIGSDSSLQSIMLNSHMDVVPAFPEHWKYGPFDGLIASDGKIYGRGTQDMKSVGMQYLEALRLLLKDKKLKRTVHVTFVPDEEIGGKLGMAKFVETDQFRKLNVGVCLDEGIASTNDEYHIYHAERTVLWLKVIATGDTGHGSRFIPNTAAEKLHYVIGKLLDFRKFEEQRLRTDPSLTLGDVTSVNLTMLNGGVQVNVVPREYIATFDVRVPPTVKLDVFQKQLENWAKEAGEGVELQFLQKDSSTAASPNSAENLWWRTLFTAFMELKCKLHSSVFFGATDARYLRQKGIACYGFSPIIHTPVLLHDHNEYIHQDMYLKGIHVYVKLIDALANAT